MRRDRWLQIEPLLQEALELPESECRAFVDRVCAGDESLRRDLEAYINAFRQDGILGKPAASHLAAIASDGVTTLPRGETPPHLTSDNPGASRKPDLLAIGTVLDSHYKIEKEIGRGATGIVYLSQDLRLGNQVVIKVLNEEVRADRNRKWIEDKFRQEIALLARIKHPGVVGALDVGKLADGRPYLVMQYVPGHSLREAITAGGMNLARVGNLMQQLCQALAAVHEHNVIHRDLKPENLLLLQAGGAVYVIIIDLGVAKVRAELAHLSQTTTMTVGTFGYMAPEQLEGHPTKASDIYALGSILYELVTGQRLFTTDDWLEMMQAQRDGSFAKPRQLRPDLPAAVEAVILKALAYDQRDRYASAKEFGDALAQALATTTTTAEQPEFVQAHVLFTDLVGYSQQTADEQARLVQTLQAAVSATASFRQAQARHRLLCLPTGDGVALVFFRDPLAPVQCAVEIARALNAHPAIKLRMGIHAGLIKHFADINQNLNSAGGGINIAQRVMDCGDAGHILLSKTVADDLAQLSAWRAHLRDLGLVEVKHDVKVHIFNLYTGEAGNPEGPSKLRRRIPVRSLLSLLLLLALLVILGVGALRYAFHNNRQHESVSTAPPSIPERHLSYSLRAQRNPKLHPGVKPFDLTGSEFIFGAGDEVRLKVSSPQSGYLYVINEGPQQNNGLPEFSVLFPYTLTNGGSAEITANQMIQIPCPSNNPGQDWFVLDNQQGVEKIWLIWGEQRVPEMEAVKGYANPQDLGVISDQRRINAVAQFLAAQAANKPAVEKDESNRQTKLTGKGEMLVSMVKLEHH